MGKILRYSTGRCDQLSQQKIGTLTSSQLFSVHLDMTLIQSFKKIIWGTIILLCSHWLLVTSAKGFKACFHRLHASSSACDGIVRFICAMTSVKSMVTSMLAISFSHLFFQVKVGGLLWNSILGISSLTLAKRLAKHLDLDLISLVLTIHQSFVIETNKLKDYELIYEKSCFFFFL